MAANAKQIIVIGAGIGGLASALALQRRGFRVAVYERASEIREIGAGVVIAPNARGALRDLGVDAALEALSCSVSVLHTCDCSVQCNRIAIVPATIPAFSSVHISDCLLCAQKLLAQVAAGGRRRIFR